MKDDINIDLIDLNILEFLRENSRMTFVQMADELGISEATVRLRVQKMDENGIIKKYTIIIGKRARLKILIFLKINPTYIKTTLNILKNVKSIESIYEITGEFNLLLIGYFENFETFRRFIWENINTIDGLKNVKSSIIMNRYKDNLIPKII